MKLSVPPTYRFHVQGGWSGGAPPGVGRVGHIEALREAFEYAGAVGAATGLKQSYLRRDLRQYYSSLFPTDESVHSFLRWCLSNGTLEENIVGHKPWPSVFLKLSTSRNCGANTGERVSTRTANDCYHSIRNRGPKMEAAVRKVFKLAGDCQDGAWLNLSQIRRDLRLYHFRLFPTDDLVYNFIKWAVENQILAEAPPTSGHVSARGDTALKLVTPPDRNRHESEPRVRGKQVMPLSLSQEPEAKRACLESCRSSADITNALVLRSDAKIKVKFDEAEVVAKDEILKVEVVESLFSVLEESQCTETPIGCCSDPRMVSTASIKLEASCERHNYHSSQVGKTEFCGSCQNQEAKLTDFVGSKIAEFSRSIKNEFLAELSEPETAPTIRKEGDDKMREVFPEAADQQLKPASLSDLSVAELRDLLLSGIELSEDARRSISDFCTQLAKGAKSVDSLAKKRMLRDHLKFDRCLDRMLSFSSWECFEVRIDKVDNIRLSPCPLWKGECSALALYPRYGTRAAPKDLPSPPPVPPSSTSINYVGLHTTYPIHVNSRISVPCTFSIDVCKKVLCRRGMPLVLGTVEVPSSEIEAVCGNCLDTWSLMTKDVVVAAASALESARVSLSVRRVPVGTEYALKKRQQEVAHLKKVMHGIQDLNSFLTKLNFPENMMFPIDWPIRGGCSLLHCAAELECAASVKMLLGAGCHPLT
jgi:hypothetical protein